MSTSGRLCDDVPRHHHIFSNSLYFFFFNLYKYSPIFFCRNISFGGGKLGFQRKKILKIWRKKSLGKFWKNFPSPLFRKPLHKNSAPLIFIVIFVGKMLGWRSFPIATPTPPPFLSIYSFVNIIHFIYEIPFFIYCLLNLLH